MNRLNVLGRKYGTDKASPPPESNHGYLNIYERYFAPMRGTAKNVLEIGVHTGSSLKMWAEYFPKAIIFGMDICKPVGLAGLPGMVLKGDQSDRKDLARVTDMVRGVGFDIVIDDGGHLMEQQQVSLGYLFPFLKPGGLYVIEDLWTSHWHGTPARPKGWFNPTETEWTTLEIMKLLRAAMRHNFASVIHIPNNFTFMTIEEGDYLLANTEEATIEMGLHSEIVFIRKKVA